MKQQIRNMIVLAAIFCFQSQSGLMAQVDYTIRFENLGTKRGTLYIGWYNKAEGFRDATQAVIRKLATVDAAGFAEVVFPNVAAGTYAVAVFYDLDGDGKLDTNILGIPKEKYGFSNNVYPTFRAASFKEAAFMVDAEHRKQTIRLR